MKKRIKNVLFCGPYLVIGFTGICFLWFTCINNSYKGWLFVSIASVVIFVVSIMLARTFYEKQ